MVAVKTAGDFCVTWRQSPSQCPQWRQVPHWRTGYSALLSNETLRPYGLSGKQCYNRLVMLVLGVCWKKGSLHPQTDQSHSNSIKASFPRPNVYDSFSMMLPRGINEWLKTHISDSWVWRCFEWLDLSYVTNGCLVLLDYYFFWNFFSSTCSNQYWTFLCICVPFPTTNILKKWRRMYLFWFLVWFLRLCEEIVQMLSSVPKSHIGLLMADDQASHCQK